jgi:FkbM family methyltransferase
MIEVWNRFLAALARKLWHFRHRRGARIGAAVLSFSAGRWAESVYGPRLMKNWGDKTFVFCLAGYYGPYFAKFLSERSTLFDLIDIGANQGIYSLIAARNPNARRIDAIEPSPSTLSLLRQNIALNRARIDVHEFAISRQNGQARFVMPEGHSGMARLSDTEGMLTVKTRNRDFFNELATRSTNPVVVKIDVEGAEHDVVTELTASELIARVTHIYAEIDERRGPDNASQKIEAMLSEKGLEIEGPRGNWRQRNVMFARALEPAAPAP